MARPVAAMLSEQTGRMTCVVIDEDEWIGGLITRGANEFMARFTLGIYQAAQQGRFAGVDPLLGQLLRREPRTVRDVLATS